ncbi:MAG: hypothetical protein ABJE10_07230 [bacterium]
MPKPHQLNDIVRPVIAAATIALLACSTSSSAPLPLDGLLPLGTWGADDAGMIVGDTAMHVHVGCTFGDVSGRIALDANGRFDVAGSYMLRAYPIAVGPSMPARFAGQLNASIATVTITVDDTVQHTTVVKGPVRVQFGSQPRMGPCPICRRPVHTKHRI